ncbi:hypothetical protein [Cerasicoccus maritimus]|uniref:hypothetical protein n=1 Tax=Cerasicoccus maritimus TaxID=490089 RepID=UPI002852BBFA|nr:hypothetical protein [Cerasicoccus maritimus]
MAYRLSHEQLVDLVRDILRYRRVTVGYRQKLKLLMGQVPDPATAMLLIMRCREQREREALLRQMNPAQRIRAMEQNDLKVVDSMMAPISPEMIVEESMHPRTSIP